MNYHTFTRENLEKDEDGRLGSVKVDAWKMGGGRNNDLSEWQKWKNF